MAREATFSSLAVWYVPDIDDNRSDPDPFAVKIQPMSGGDLAQLEVTEADTVSKRIIAANEAILRKHVLEVKGYAVINAESGERIIPTDGASFVEALRKGPASEQAVMRDILQAIEKHSKLKEGLLGK